MGDVTKGHTIEQLDAIQEFINYKYNLKSPKDFLVMMQIIVRFLSRVKGDLYKEHNAQLKGELLSCIENDNIENYSVFKSIVAEYGELH